MELFIIILFFGNHIQATISQLILCFNICVCNYLIRCLSFLSMDSHFQLASDSHFQLALFVFCEKTFFKVAIFCDGILVTQSLLHMSNNSILLITFERQFLSLGNLGFWMFSFVIIKIFSTSPYFCTLTLCFNIWNNSFSYFYLYFCCFYGAIIINSSCLMQLCPQGLLLVMLREQYWALGVKTGSDRCKESACYNISLIP